MPNQTNNTDTTGILASMLGLGNLSSLLSSSKPATNKKKSKTVAQPKEDSITTLTNSILQSAAGKPFSFSMSEQEKKKNMAKDFVRLMLLNGIGKDVTSSNSSDKDKNKGTKTK